MLNNQLPLILWYDGIVFFLNLVKAFQNGKFLFIHHIIFQIALTIANYNTIKITIFLFLLSTTCFKYWEIIVILDSSLTPNNLHHHYLYLPWFFFYLSPPWSTTTMDLRGRHYLRLKYSFFIDTNKIANPWLIYFERHITLL